MTDTKGNIRARKLGNTGITEEMLKKIADKKGGHILAIIELKATAITEQVDGDDVTVDFLIDTIEPVEDGKLNGTITGHVRDIAAALYRNRQLAENGPTLPGLGNDGPEPKVKDVLAAGKGLIGNDDDGPKILTDDEALTLEDLNEEDRAEVDAQDAEASANPDTPSADPDTAEDPWSYPEGEGPNTKDPAPDPAFSAKA